jgi:Protein of unknown function DUF72
LRLPARAPRGLTRARKLYAIFALLQAHRAAYRVVSGRTCRACRATADLVFVPMHGPDHQHLYPGSCPGAGLTWRADRTGEWDLPGRDMFAHFSNDGNASAVRNARTLPGTARVRRCQPSGCACGQPGLAFRGRFVTQARVAKEIDRLLAHRDAGQTGAESWTVLAEREGNQFCAGARPKETLIRTGSALSTADRPCPRQMSRSRRRVSSQMTLAVFAHSVD